MNQELMDQFSRENGSVKPVVLDADAVAFSQRNYQDIAGALAFLMENVQGGTLTEGVRTSTLGVAEGNLVRLIKTLGYDGVLERESKARYEQVRALNGKVRELEEKLGQANLTPAIKEQIEFLHKKVERWWCRQGFSLVREAGFGRYRFKAEFSCMINDHFLAMMEEKPISRKEAIAQRIAQMQKIFQIATDGDRERNLLDNDHNRAALIRVFADAMPSAEILYTKSHSSRVAGKRQMCFWDIEVMIDVEDIVALADGADPEAE